MCPRRYPQGSFTDTVGRSDEAGLIPKNNRSKQLAEHVQPHARADHPRRPSGNILEFAQAQPPTHLLSLVLPGANFPSRTETVKVVCDGAIAESACQRHTVGSHWIRKSQQTTRLLDVRKLAVLLPISRGFFFFFLFLIFDISGSIVALEDLHVSGGSGDIYIALKEGWRTR